MDEFRRSCRHGASSTSMFSVKISKVCHEYFSKTRILRIAELPNCSQERLWRISRVLCHSHKSIVESHECTFPKGHERFKYTPQVHLQCREGCNNSRVSFLVGTNRFQTRLIRRSSIVFISMNTSYLVPNSHIFLCLVLEPLVWKQLLVNLQLANMSW